MDMWDILSAHPWIPAVMAVSFAIWIASIVVIVRSPKFLRKVLWVLLTLFQFSFSWGGGHWTISVAIPLGALYVLWFWKFGAAPTAEQLAARAARQQPVTGARWRVRSLRVAYLLAVGATALMAFLIISGAVMKQMNAMMGEDIAPDPTLQQFETTFSYVGGGVLLALAGLFVFLAFRPFWWGKLLCLFAGLAWLMNGLMMTAFGSGGATSSLIATSGGLMIIAALLHQIADPRFSGTWMRSA